MSDQPRTLWCKHHERVLPISHRCKLGLDVEAITTEQVGAEKMGRHYMVPCHTNSLDHIRKATCERRELPTPEEIAREDAERAEWIKEAERRLLLTAPLVSDIKKKTKASGKDLTGSTACPVCEGGTVQFACAIYNLHVRMRCATIDCINWME